MQIMRDYALQFVGKPYIWGGDDPINGFDCSGFVQELLASVGMDPPGDQNAQGLFDHFQDKSTPNVQKCGSLVFYGKSVTKITHVAMMIDQYRMIEAGGGGSSTTSAEAASAKNAFVRIRLINRRPDIVAVLYPRYATIGLV
jgi:cell wall-associated NlpC family hydrolase